MPETDEAEKRLKAVQADLKRYKSSEPCISLEFEGAAKDSYTLTGDYVVYSELTEDEVEALTRTLQTRLPEQTDFDAKEPKKTSPRDGGKIGTIDVASFSFELRQSFTPASKEEVNQYKKEYAGWIEGCRELLRTLHIRLQFCQPPLRLAALLSNVGSRPAENALVTFSANGHFLIQPPPELTKTCFGSQVSNIRQFRQRVDGATLSTRSCDLAVVATCCSRLLMRRA